MSRFIATAVALLVGLLWNGCSQVATIPTRPKVPDADAEFAAIVRRSREQPPPQFAHGSEQAMLWMKARLVEVYDRGTAFMAAHPTDPRRWGVLVLLQNGREHTVTTLADGSKNLAPERGAREAWERQYYPMLENLIAADDASRDARREAFEQLIYHTCLKVRRGEADAGSSVAKVRRWLPDYRRDFPDSHAFGRLYHDIAMMLNAVDHADARAFATNIRDLYRGDEFSSRYIRLKMEGLLRLFEGQERPPELLWTHLQKIEPGLNPSDYRDKVVLIPILAVDWSSNTMELERLYAAYHAAGLEILHVAYYNGNTAAPPVQRDKAAMRNYVDERGWLWRVVWDPKDRDGSLWDEWGQNTVPAEILLGRDGRIVIDSTRTREKLIEELLARPAGKFVTAARAAE